MNMHDLIDANDVEGIRQMVTDSPASLLEKLDETYPDLPVHSASGQDTAEMLAVLLDAGADIEARGVCGRTALHTTALEGAIEPARLLLQRGANTEAKDDFGFTPILYAVRSRDHRSMDVAKMLVEAGAFVDLNSQISLGDVEGVMARLRTDPTEIERAIDPGALLDDVVILLLGDMSDDTGRKLAQIAEVEAVFSRYRPLMQCILDAGFDIDALATNIRPALFSAVESNLPIVVRWLLEHGASLTATLSDGKFKTAFKYIQSKNGEATREILEEFAIKRGQQDLIPPKD